MESLRVEDISWTCPSWVPESHEVLDRWGTYPPGWDFLPTPCLNLSSTATYQQVQSLRKDKGTSFLFPRLE